MTRWTLDRLGNVEAVAPRLLAAGLPPGAAAEKSDLFRIAVQAIAENESGRDATAFAWFVPGRVEVLGKHTDYAGGRSLVAATTQGFCAVAMPRADSVVRVIEATGKQSVEFALSPDIVPTVGHWSNYPTTVARRLARNFGCTRGANLAFASDLPLAAGMSSSSALIIAVLALLADVNELEGHPAYRWNIRERLDFAGYAATIENGQTFRDLAGDQGVGTFGGSEDHTAILDSRPGMLGQYSYCPVRLERRIAVPEPLTFAVAASGVVAEKTGAARDKYNLASRMASAITELWRTNIGRDEAHLAAAVASATNAADAIRELLRTHPHRLYSATDLRDRFEHFYAESEQIIPAVGSDLLGDTLVNFGQLVDRSQSLAEELLHNQVPETIQLARVARSVGAAASSAFGAGFGGSVWALVEEANVESFLDEWQRRYAEAFPEPARRAKFFVTRPGPSAFALSM